MPDWQSIAKAAEPHKEGWGPYNRSPRQTPIVLCSRSMASVAMPSAVSKPKVTSLPVRSLRPSKVMASGCAGIQACADLGYGLASSISSLSLCALILDCHLPRAVLHVQGLSPHLENNRRLQCCKILAFLRRHVGRSRNCRLRLAALGLCTPQPGEQRGVESLYFYKPLKLIESLVGSTCQQGPDADECQHLCPTPHRR